MIQSIVSLHKTTLLWIWVQERENWYLKLLKCELFGVGDEKWVNMASSNHSSVNQWTCQAKQRYVYEREIQKNTNFLC